MSRGDGLYRRGEVWWMTWRTPDGKRHRASTREHYHEQAKAVRDRSMGELANGRAVVAPGRLTFEDLCALIRTDYDVQRRRSRRTLERSLACLAEYFKTRKAASITWSDSQTYRTWRRGKGWSDAYVNRHLAALKHALRLAVKDGKLAAVPLFEIVNPHNARQGFFEADDFEAMVAQLPAAYQPVARFAYLTGWRTCSEVLPLRWAQVDHRAGTVRLEPNTTKNDEGRLFPFGVLPALVALVREQHTHANGPWVFHQDGKRIGYEDYLRTWRRACDAAECRDRIPHDLRRTAVRNLERAGVSRSVAMKLTGHRTEEVYRRYAIVAEADLREGVKKLAQVTSESHSED